MERNIIKSTLKGRKKSKVLFQDVWFRKYPTYIAILNWQMRINKIILRHSPMGRAKTSPPSSHGTAIKSGCLNTQCDFVTVTTLLWHYCDIVTLLWYCDIAVILWHCCDSVKWQTNSDRLAIRYHTLSTLSRWSWGDGLISIQYLTGGRLIMDIFPNNYGQK